MTETLVRRIIATQSVPADFAFTGAAIILGGFFAFCLFFDDFQDAAIGIGVINHLFHLLWFCE